MFGLPLIDAVVGGVSDDHVSGGSQGHVFWFVELAVVVALGADLAEIPAFRRKGIAKKLLKLMMYEVYQMDYKVFSYDTFPNKHRGMIILGLNEGFKISDAKWNEYYQDYQIHLEKDLVKYFESI